VTTAGWVAVAALAYLVAGSTLLILTLRSVELTVLSVLGWLLVWPVLLLILGWLLMLEDTRVGDALAWPFRQVRMWRRGADSTRLMVALDPRPGEVRHHRAVASGRRWALVLYWFRPEPAEATWAPDHDQEASA
jgi:hypothetical protein